MKRFVLYICFLSILIPCIDNKPSIRENFFNDEIIGYYLSAIDLESGESTTLLFDYAIDLCEGQDSKLILKYDVSMFMPLFNNEMQKLSNGKVDLTEIPSNLSSISFRNTDLNASTSELSGGVKFDLDEDLTEVNLTDGEIKEIADLFLSQTRAPNGIYTFNFTIESEDGVVYDSISKTIEVFVPSFLDLITPGSPDLSDSLSNVVMMTNPIFQWNSDYCNKCNFFIRISEFRVTDHSSLEEALDDYSVLPLNDNYFELSQNTNTFQYPSSGVGELYPGKMYVWQIMRTYMTSNGINEEFSPIYLFKIQSQDLTTDSDKDLNLENLKLFIGADVYENLFNEEGILNGYNSVLTSIKVDNQSLSINYLLELISKKNQGNLTIVEVNVE
tara:strand:- start:936 stop:2096 length:1161 start_codon:yes stop_codon:yes gene_type:complete